MAGEHIVIVDFSYARPILETIAQSAASLVVLDHHITAEQTLADLPYAYFDLKNQALCSGGNGLTMSRRPGCCAIFRTKIYGIGRCRIAVKSVPHCASYPFDFALWSSFQQKELEWEGRAILRYENELITNLPHTRRWCSLRVAQSPPFIVRCSPVRSANDFRRPSILSHLARPQWTTILQHALTRGWYRCWLDCRIIRRRRPHPCRRIFDSVTSRRIAPFES